MKALTLTGTVILLAVASAADAREFPGFAAEGYCLEVSEFDGGSEKVYDGCIELEQDAYKQLMARWGNLSEETQGHCVAVAMASGESYSVLQDCVDLAIAGAGTGSNLRQE